MIEGCNMAEDTKIQWCDHTFNPWRGCTKISAGCQNCYAETMSKRNTKTLGIWGPHGTRVVASESMWREPMKWDREAEKAGVRKRVFCASMADVFEDWTGPMSNSTGQHLWWDTDRDGKSIWGTESGFDPQPVTIQDVRRRLFALIDSTPHLDWLLLTKRPGNILRMMPPIDLGDPDDEDWRSGMDPEARWRRGNLWIGASVENETTKSRIDDLRKVTATVRFLSMEPLLEDLGTINLTGIQWVIVGGESGPGARPFHIDWARDLRDQCKAAGVAFFMKQLGSDPVMWQRSHEYPSDGCDVSMNWIEDPKGGDPSEWPEDLRIREFPNGWQATRIEA